MITVIYAYRNRGFERIKRSLDSLKIQTNKKFNVLFVDYGSSKSIKNRNHKLIANYSFVDYIYTYSIDQPWNKSRALNIAIKKTKTQFVFIADIDMIFHNLFIEKLNVLKSDKKNFFFKVGFLSQNESQNSKKFEDYKINFVTNQEAKGLSLFYTKHLKNINGFDEFFHFWGSEDVDIHNRLNNVGISSVFIEDEILILHQWHQNYANSQKNVLTKDLQLKNIEKINYQHLLYNKKNEIQKVNSQNWGLKVDKADYDTLNDYNKPIELTNKFEIVQHFLHYTLPSNDKKILHVKFGLDSKSNTTKTKIKQVLKRDKNKFLSLKEINDLLLLHLISFYRDELYIYKVSDQLDSLELKILFK